jgi:methylmalonyl-CoA mutase C-terminal domain/subunit
VEQSKTIQQFYFPRKINICSKLTENTKFAPRMNNKQSGRPIRVLVAKVGLDGHDRGAKVIASALRDAGMEVIYTGLRQTPEMVVQTALQEDVDAIGISILSGAHNTVFPRVMALMKESGLDDVLLTGGGIIPDADAEELNKQGVARLFPPGTEMAVIIDYIQEWVKTHRNF